ncbi:MAG TPA: hypothetical protein PKW80_08990 [Bacteroidales bacterium]|nr:hypothetical protein [Bacteroidales bacterium]
MKPFILSVLALCFWGITESCNDNKENKNHLILTERIQYPVFIKSPYKEETDWWRENMEGPSREKFVNIILDAVETGNVKAYDYITDAPLDKAQLDAVFNRSDTIMLTRTTPPYNEYDTVINTKLDRKYIHRITFLEEWYFDEKNFKMEKKVVGIAPAMTYYGDSAEIIGYKPLFWVFLDDKYPLKK